MSSGRSEAGSCVAQTPRRCLRVVTAIAQTLRAARAWSGISRLADREAFASIVESPRISPMQLRSPRC